FQWNPGDGSDTVQGGTGRDAMTFNGSDDAENFDVSANGTHAQFSRDAGVAVDLNGVEQIDLSAAGGADTIIVNDLSGTDVIAVNLDLGPVGDGAADAVVVSGTDRDDAIGVQIVPLAVTGLHALVTMTNAG